MAAAVPEPSRATELAAEYPAAAREAWMGHTAEVATAHHHTVREEDDQRAKATPTGKATTKVTTQARAPKRTMDSNTPVEAALRAVALSCASVREDQVAPAGFEPTH